MTENSFELSHTFNHPWARIFRAYLAKYPHPRLSHVNSINTLERYVDEKGRLITRRLMTSSFLKFTSIHGLEQSIIDPIKKTIYIVTNNLNYRSLTTSCEICRYSMLDLNSTRYTLSYTIDYAMGMGLFIDRLFSTIKKNNETGLQVLEEIIKTRFPNFEFIDFKAL